MKTASLPSLRVSPELRDAAERVLRDGESISSFIESSVQAQIESRETQAAFIERGLQSRDEARRTGEYFEAADVLDELDAIAEEHAKKRRA